MVDGMLASLLVIVGHASPVIAGDFSAEANQSEIPRFTWNRLRNLK